MVRKLQCYNQLKKVLSLSMICQSPSMSIVVVLVYALQYHILCDRVSAVMGTLHTELMKAHHLNSTFALY